MEKVAPLPILVLVQDDPRVVDGPYLDPDISGVRVVAYVIPLEVAQCTPGKLKFREIPIITWEDPEPYSDATHALQYWTLLRITEVNHVLCAGWRIRLFETRGVVHVRHLASPWDTYGSEGICRIARSLFFPKSA